jgi:hypothetical protein
MIVLQAISPEQFPMSNKEIKQLNLKPELQAKILSSELCFQQIKDAFLDREALLDISSNENRWNPPEIKK